MCVVSGDRDRFGANTYGGNVCEFIVYGESSEMTATWGNWKQVAFNAI